MKYLHGGDIYTYQNMIDFSANINPLGPGEAVIEAARAAVQQMDRYPDATCRHLRSVVAERLVVEPEKLIFGNGAAELIFALTMARRPRRALLTAPSFAEYQQALQAVDCTICYYPLAEPEGFILGEQYLEYLTAEIDMIFLCSPSNPVGNIIDHQLLLQILRKCREHRITMVIDECFYEFLDTWQEDTLQREVDAYPELFILRAFTKLHAMPGLRLGYGISSDSKLLEQMERMRQPWSISVVAQAAGVAAAQDQTRAAVTRAYIRKEREWLLAEFERIGIVYYPPMANYIFLRSEFDLFKLLKQRGILIRDCSNYEGLTKGYYRLAVRTHEENQKMITELEDIYANEKNG